MNWTKFNIVLSVITIVVMGFVVLNPAHASSGCLDKHENVSRINPTELSDYQKCVHKFYGNTAGTVGTGTVWFYANGEFHHVSKDDVLNATGDDLEHLIVKTILQDAAAKQLAEAQAQLETLNAARLLLEGEVGDLKTLNASLATQVATLTTKVATLEALTTQSSITAYVTTRSVDQEIQFQVTTMS